MVTVEIPFHLRTLAKVDGAVKLDVPAPVTLRSVLDALEAKFPPLRGTIRDHGSDKRRPLLRFYACQKDYSNASPDEPLPEKIARGEEPLLILGAIAGG